MIKMDNLSKTYDKGVKALNDVTLHIYKGEFLFLVGSSGAGKSTIIKLISREELPTRGKVHFDGKNITRFNGKEVANLRRRIGMVFQDFRLMPQKNVFENVAFALQIAGTSRKKILKAVPPVLKRVVTGFWGSLKIVLAPSVKCLMVWKKIILCPIHIELKHCQPIWCPI